MHWGWTNTGDNLSDGPSARQALDYYDSFGITEPQFPETPFDPNYAELAFEALSVLRGISVSLKTGFTAEYHVFRKKMVAVRSKPAESEPKKLKGITLRSKDPLHLSWPD